ncbi:MAG TPA: hypothetical protein VFE28_12200 [Candidatus Krumholzibacteria bacterium]|nr:hypothetical protein [Candidatus Krumholzibacteria bacterium]
MSRRILSLACAGLCAMLPELARAGVTNPDISVVGQPFFAVTDDPNNLDRNRLVPDLGEVELVFEAYLNPYARGYLRPTIGEEGLEVEEGYFHLLRGLPLGFSLRGGQYRVGFGRLNQMHPHMLPFAERFGVMAAYLPGEEAVIEIGASVSNRIPIHGDFSVDLAADWLRGDSFRIQREPSTDPADPLNTGGDDHAGEHRPAYNGRLTGFAMLGEQSALEFGLSGLGGTNNVAAGTTTQVYGADLKAKLWTSPRAYLVLQAEGLVLEREDAAWDSASAGYTSTRVRPVGGSMYANYNFALRYNVGASYEQYQEPEPDKPWSQSVGAFAGYSLLEETTVFAADWRRFIPETGDAVDTFTLRVIFSMGPHKAHQF